MDASTLEQPLRKQHFALKRLAEQIEEFAVLKARAAMVREGKGLCPAATVPDLREALSALQLAEAVRRVGAEDQII